VFVILRMGKGWDILGPKGAIRRFMNAGVRAWVSAASGRKIRPTGIPAAVENRLGAGDRPGREEIPGFSA
jgi:hypothetical protein